MTIFVTALAFFLLLSVLILIHELGHFLAARKAGVTVEEFGFGLPPAAITVFTQGGTRFTLNWIPFGGFVRLKGENAISKKERTAPGSFASASIPARISILVAGVFMNFILAILLLTFGFSVGRWVPTYESLESLDAAVARGEVTAQFEMSISELVPGSPAETAGLPIGGKLIKVDGTPVSRVEDVVAIQKDKVSVVYTVLSGAGESVTEADYTVRVTDGIAGVKFAASRMLSAPTRNVWQGFVLSLRETVVATKQTAYGMSQLVVSLVLNARVPEGITGIVGIAQLTYLSVQDGLMTYLRLVALLSLSLAILNILPFPALDGGRLLFVLVEFVTRRPVNRRFELFTNAFGFAFLLLLIVVITFNDIFRLFQGS